MRSFRNPCIVVALVSVLSPALARGDEITHDRITVQAKDPAAVRIEHVLTWEAGANSAPVRDLVFHLARGVTVTAARSGGSDLEFSASPVADSYLDRWKLQLAEPLAPGKSREIALTTSIAEPASGGIRIGGGSGMLLPGSGWVPATAPESDEVLPYQVAFRLPDGQTGVAAGTGRGGVWTSGQAVRPFAVWGTWTRTEFQRGAVSCVAYRRSGASGDVPGTGDLEALLYALDTGLGPLEGDAPWTFVDVGGGQLAGGFRTVLWDEQRAAAGGPLWNRDLAGALAVSYWTESIRFTGPLAALFSRSFPLYLGDAAATTLDDSDTRWKTEVALVGPRRDEFAAHRSEDEVLRGLLPSAPHAPLVLRTRGTLVVHMTEAVGKSTAAFISFLRRFRGTHSGTTVDGDAFGTELTEHFGKRARFLPGYLDTKDLPDFVIGDHGPAEPKTGPTRYSVEVENRGKIADIARISTFDPHEFELYKYELVLKPGEKRAVQFGNINRIARVEIDPRHRSLQLDYAGEVIERDISSGPVPHRPAFEFVRAHRDFRWVTGFRFDLDGVSIHDFEGYVMWYGTHHGPSGLVMFGDAHVDVAPPPPHAESFRKAMGRERMEFTTPKLFVRFPLSRWQEIGEQLEAAEVRPPGPKEKDVRFLYEYSFPTHFAERSLAQVPPPGAALVIFSLGGVERRGFVRDLKADGTIYARFWDQLRGVTLWEDTR